MPDIPRSIAAQYALWFRKRRGESFVLVAVGVTSQELTDKIATFPQSGQWWTGKVGEDPNRHPASIKTIPRREPAQLTFW